MRQSVRTLGADHRPLYLQAVDALYDLLEEGGSIKDKCKSRQ